MKMLSVLIAALGLALGASSASADGYAVQMVPASDSFVQPMALNNNGLLGGIAYETVESFWSNGFLGTPDGYTVVPPMSNNGMGAWITGVADDGSACGISVMDGVLNEAFRRTPEGAMYDLRTLNGLGENSETIATGMNNEYICGYVSTWVGGQPLRHRGRRQFLPVMNRVQPLFVEPNSSYLDRACVWDNKNVLHYLDPVDGAFPAYAYHIAWDGVIDGYGHRDGTWTPCYWQDANAPITWLSIPDGWFGVAHAGYGNVHVGYVGIKNDPSSDFAARWVGDTIEILHDLGGGSAQVYAVDQSGNAYGISTTSDNHPHAVKWPAGSPDPINLDTDAPDGWNLMQVTEVNEHGQLAVTGSKFIQGTGTVRYAPFLLTPIATSVDLNDCPSELEHGSSFSIKPNGRIEFTIAKAGRVALEVYDVSGRQVGSINGTFPAGKNTLRWDDRPAASGIYFLRLTTPDKVFTSRVTVLR